MAPLPPSTTTTTTTYYSHPRSLRRRQDERAGGARKSLPPPHRSASFHGRTMVAASTVEHRQMQRPKTQPDLLAGGRRGMAASPEEKRLGRGGDRSFEAERRMLAKVLVNVTVQRSLGPVQVMASTEWTVGDLVAAALRQYVKEGRRPPLPTTEPSAFGLHYSRFSLEHNESDFEDDLQIGQKTSGKLDVMDGKGKPVARKVTAGNKNAASAAKPKTKRKESIKADKPKADEDDEDEDDDDEEDDSAEVSNEDEVDMAETPCDSDDEDEDEDSEEADEATPKKGENGKKRPC
ncbi:hypothetical protein COCNU_15G000120 [Cocos nucifera]|uniref:DUF7054 domain-containing protein n=1 Tax=Cocos nucifera TaxID=13894 RepID=A0A8K0IX10_COCNU|nr:hypothetical protein COCNU_15G000120 [Cocos nucifera]